MKKVVIIILFTIIVFCGVMSAYADEYNYTYYDYETGEEKQITLTDEDILLKIGTLNGKTNKSNSSEALIDEETEAINTLKTMSSGTYVSTLSVIEGKRLVKVSSLVSHYKKIVCLRTYINGSEYCGTGFMIGSNIMLTAGHCMYSQALNKNVDEMRVYYLQNGDVISSNYTYPAGWIVPNKYKAGDDNYDWCIVFLQQHIGNTTGYFNYAVTPNSASSVFVSGYPSESDVYQYSSSGALSYYNAYQFYHTCSTLGGHSGAPIFGAGGTVYGIHTYGSNLASPKHNWGNSITQELFNTIEYYN